MKTTLTPLALAVALVVLAPAARAGVILQPASASTNMLGSDPGATRNQSGLSAGYTSLVTDFDAYIAGNPTHNSLNLNNDWVSLDVTGNFDFDLGGTFTIESFALWNLGENATENVRGFELLASADSSFSSPTSLGSFNASPNTGSLGAVLPQVFTFTPTSAAFVRLRITSNNGSTLNTIFGEAAFEVRSAPAVVPGPGSLALLAAGGACLLGYARRRRAS